ncbi:MAG TPA: uracil-DNA glycosylase [Candidatus Limnocylindria bacterium]|jgi:uracil-DNA glycosylase
MSVPDVVARPSERGSREPSLIRLHREIRACTRCVEAGLLPAAAPVVAGRRSDRIMIVGQAPGAVEVTTRVPFSGRAGAELGRWLARAGIDRSALPYRTSITKCYPGKAPDGPGDRVPSRAEIALCAPWLEAELTVLRPAVILPVGLLAIRRLWGPGALASIVGRSRRSPELDGALLIPLPHPSGASRWLNQPTNRRLLDRALALVASAARGLDA